jgi:hypothetical protein
MSLKKRMFVPHFFKSSVTNIGNTLLASAILGRWTSTPLKISLVFKSPELRVKTVTSDPARRTHELYTRRTCLSLRQAWVDIPKRRKLFSNRAPSKILHIERKIILCVVEAYTQTKLVIFLQFSYAAYKVGECFAWPLNSKI